MNMISFSKAAFAAAAVLATTTLAAQNQELALELGTEISWPTTIGNTYELQSANAPSGPWASEIAATLGDGTMGTHYYSDGGAVQYFQILETIPGTDPVPPNPVNGGFEAGTGASADNWNTYASAPPTRIDTDAHTGTYSMRSALQNGAAGTSEGGMNQQIADAGGEIVGGTSYDFSFWAKQITAGASYVQQYNIEWKNASNATIGGTGLQNFNVPVGGPWTQVTVPGLVAPATAVDATISFRFVTGAVANDFGEVLIDDIVLDSGEAAGPGTPATVNTLPVTSSRVANLSWPSISGVSYQPEFSNDLGIWSPIAPVIAGDDSTKTVSKTLAQESEFFRVDITIEPVLPPTNLRTAISGSDNSVGLTWSASPTAGVTSYRILYGLISGNLDQTLEVGNVTTAAVPNLIADETYYFSVVAVTGASESPVGDAEISAVPNEALTLIPLFNSNTVLEPAISVETDTALYTYLADRVRARHAREGQFNRYDIYLSFYWEQRILKLEIVDYVAKGGTDITFNYTTLRALTAAEFRTFFGGVSTVAQYNSNQLATLVSTNPSAIPGETDYNYTATISQNFNEGNRPLQVGDRVEIEISQFLNAPRNGQANYYGTTLLYVVGQGIVPWGQANDLGIGNPGPNDILGGVRLALDSYPIPETAWLGGLTTNHYQYSDEPKQSFKQMAGNISPTNGYEFLLGRRLHHTNFETGAHSEAGNPIFTEHVGKLGPKYINNSCIDCHTDNGRSLPPPLSSALLKSVVKVGSDAGGSPHPSLGSVFQPEATDSSAEGSIVISSYTTTAGQYGDGTSYELRKPNYTFTGTTPEFYSVRGAPQLVGLGLLEAIDENTIADLADPTDQDQDGISGRMSIVTDPETGEPRLGRFTHKAAVATVEHQIAAALNTDMGVTTSIQPILDGETTGETPELSDVDLDYMTRYVALLGVNAQRDLQDPDVILGEQVFTAANCVACHIPSMDTGPNHPYAELRNQTIRPFTDLLLHDMGPGLADNMSDGNASGSEWRTAPLWSIGLTAGVSGGEAYLHDGRARTLEEAILWHGGEAEDAKEFFRTLPADERAALIKFLKSL